MADAKELGLKEDVPLPKSLAELIRLAVHDLEACEKDANYRLDMSVMHSAYKEESRCRVCFAGSVLSKTLGASRYKRFMTTIGLSDWDPLFSFLNGLRSYDLTYALDQIPASHPLHASVDRMAFRYACEATLREAGLLSKKSVIWDGEHYHKNPNKFKKSMLVIAQCFSDLGL